MSKSICDISLKIVLDRVTTRIPSKMDWENPQEVGLML